MIVKRRIFMALAFMLTFILATANFNDAEAATKASFDNGNAFCTVRINQNLLDKKGKQYATVTLRTYDVLGHGSKGQMEIIMRDENGNHIWSGIRNSGVKLKLGDDHHIYRIYVRKHSAGGNNPNWKQQGDNFINNGALQSWEFTNANNCSIS